MGSARETLVGCWALLTLVAGCSSEIPLRTPIEAPTVFDNAPPSQTMAWPSKDWYRGFSSDELNSFIDLSTAGNWDLAAARARVAQADARARQAGASRLPSVDANGSGNFLAGHSSYGTRHETDWSALVSASYEIDFWGKNRATANAASFLATASRADRDALALTTLAAVADGYFQLLALRERVVIAKSNLGVARNVLGVIQARHDAGMASPGELASQKAAAAVAALAIPEIEQQESDGRTALAALLGRVPEAFEVPDKPLDSLTEPTVMAGLPAELLRRRPDVFVAEANLQSAHADLTAARAALFPNISLTAAAGVQNPALNAAILSVPGTGTTLSLGASLVQSVFDNGRLRAVRAEAEAKEQELLAAYRGAIVAALVDVENALAAIHHLDAARQFQMENLTQSELAFEGARLRYQAGSGEYVTLLEAQRALYTARDQNVQFKLARLQALVALCKALGGGWDQVIPAERPTAGL